MTIDNGFDRAERLIEESFKSGKPELSLSGIQLTTLPESIGKLTQLSTLDLRVNNLTTLPESMGNLTQLSTLYLGYNKNLTTLPEWIGKLVQLSTLNLGGNNLTTLPEWIGKLIQLSSLNVTFNKLTTLPESIGKLTQLSTLNLYSNNLTTLPESIGKLTQLSTLDLYSNNLTTLPESMGNLTQLSTLYLGYNKNLTTLPEWIGKLVQLSTLNLGGNNLTTLPEWIGKLIQLSELNLCDNNLTTLPEWIGKLTKLTTLSVSSNNLTTLPESIGKLIQLTTLDLYSNNLTTLPEWIGKLTKLTTLDLHSNNLSTLPESIGKLIQLSTLNLYSNNLTTLPEWIGKLTKLTTLNVSGNNLSTLPESIGKLIQLSMLNLYSNNLTTLPEWIGKLTQLTTLSVSSNNLTTLPEWIGKLTQLTTLNVSSNNLSTLPESIGKLTQLTTLALGDNNLTTLPECISKLTRLSRLHLEDNNNLTTLPENVDCLTKLDLINIFGTQVKLNCDIDAEPLASLTHSNLRYLVVSHLLAAPQALASQSKHDNALPRILRWQKDIRESGVTPEGEIKVLILGNGRVGKSELRRRLSGKDYSGKIPPTHGIEIEPIAGDFKDQSGKAIRFRFWDFGGQDIYLNSHSMFLDERAICVIAWHPNYENDHPFIESGIEMRNRRLDYWLEYVRNFAGPKTPVILVQTQCDQHSQERDAPISSEHGFGFLKRTHSSAKLDGGLAALQTALVTQANVLLEQYGEVKIPNRWVDISIAIRERRSKKIIPLSEFEDLCTDLADVNVSPILLEYFHRSGELFWPKNAIKDSVFLDLNWCFAAIYSLFDRRIVYPVLIEHHGQFKPQFLKQTLWQKYSEKECEVLLSLMLQCRLCFSLDKDREVYLAPHALPKAEAKKKTIQVVWPQSEAESSVSMRYPFLSEGIIHSMLSSLGQVVGADGCYWQYGCCFFDSNAKSRAFVEAFAPQNEDTHGEIIISTSGGQASDLANHLLQSFKTLNPIKAPKIIWTKGQQREPSDIDKDETKPFCQISSMTEIGKGPITTTYENLGEREALGIADSEAKQIDNCKYPQKVQALIALHEIAKAKGYTLRDTLLGISSATLAKLSKWPRDYSELDGMKDETIRKILEQWKNLKDKDHSDFPKKMLDTTGLKSLSEPRPKIYKGLIEYAKYLKGE